MCFVSPYFLSAIGGACTRSIKILRACCLWFFVFEFSREQCSQIKKKKKKRLKGGEAQTWQFPLTILLFLFHLVLPKGFFLARTELSKAFLLLFSSLSSSQDSNSHASWAFSSSTGTGSPGTSSHMGSNKMPAIFSSISGNSSGYTATTWGA